jgi:hypothetical protein
LAISAAFASALGNSSATATRTGGTDSVICAAIRFWSLRSLVKAISRIAAGMV